MPNSRLRRHGSSRADSRSGAGRLRVFLVVCCLAILLVSCSGSPSPRSKSLLVVGDSVAWQAAEPLIHLAPEGAAVTVDAVQPGSAPCDWNHGFTDPTNGEFDKFSTIFERIRPSVVVFVFTGNPGLSGPTAGCVDANSPYDLSQLLPTYESSIIPMADMAARAGAVVYFEAPPPRNPAVPVGYDPQKQENRGFQGSAAIDSFYESLATKDSRHWHYDDSAAMAVSSPDLQWVLTLPCEEWDAKLCTDGRIAVRAGGTDAVHLDERGCGAVRFALALDERVFSFSSPDPKSVAATVSEYGGCQ
jgi:hypothetical protein